MTELLLGDIRDIFARRAANKVEPADRIPSGDLVEALVGIEGRPWAEMGKARKPLTQNRLARLLKPLAIAPENIRIGDKVPKGYLLERSRRPSHAIWAQRGLPNRYTATTPMKWAQVTCFKPLQPNPM